MQKQPITLLLCLMVAVAACFVVTSTTSATPTKTTIMGGADGSGTTLSVTLNGTATEGNLLIAVIDSYVTTSQYATVQSIAQTGVTWAKAVSGSFSDSNYKNCEIWYGYVGLGSSTTVTITFAIPANFGSKVVIREYSGLVNTNVLDQTAKACTYQNTIVNFGTTNITTHPYELWIAGTLTDPNPAINPTNGFTFVGMSQRPSCGYFEKAVTTTGNATLTATMESAVTTIGVIATFIAQEPPSHTVTVTQTAGGTISPETANYTQGNNVIEIITPTTGNHIVNITVDGSPVIVTNQTQQTVTFNDIQANHSITAIYEVTPTVTTTPTNSPTNSTSSTQPSLITFGDQKTIIVLMIFGFLLFFGGSVGIALIKKRW